MPTIRDVARLAGVSTATVSATINQSARVSEALQARVRVAYPVNIDRAIGLGIPPSLRLQRRLARPGRITPADQALIWTHWAWFLIPHGTVAYHLWRHRDRFPRAAVLTYAVFDLGVLVYWILPTAPPWYAAREGVLEDARAPELRRMMIEHGEVFWRGNWDRLYGLLGGNPLAAMPSLHFATSVMAAHLLTELGPLEGAIGWTYASTLGVALVYLGEHYVADLLAGLALTPPPHVLDDAGGLDTQGQVGLRGVLADPCWQRTGSVVLGAHLVAVAHRLDPLAELDDLALAQVEVRERHGDDLVHGAVDLDCLAGHVPSDEDCTAATVGR